MYNKFMMVEQSKEDYLTVAEAAIIRGCTPTRIYQLIAAGQIPMERHYGIMVIAAEHRVMLMEKPKRGRPRGKQRKETDDR